MDNFIVEVTTSCDTCRNVGLPGGCPSCKRIPNQRNATVAVTEELVKSWEIPEEYKALATWNEERLREDFLKFQNNNMFDNYVKQLAVTHEIFRKGNLPKTSLFVIAPKRLSKMTWAYSCMREALAHNYTVAPLIDTQEYNRLNVLSSEKVTSKHLRLLPYTLESVNYADVLFVTVDKAYYQGSIRVLDSILDKRSRLGKPTVILSRYTVAELSRGDYSNAGVGLIDKSRRNNTLRYPHFIELRINL